MFQFSVNKLYAVGKLILVDCTTPAGNRWEDFVRTKPLLGEGLLNDVQYKKQHFFVTHRQSYLKKERLRQLYITVSRHLRVDLSFTRIRINIIYTCTCTFCSALGKVSEFWPFRLRWLYAF